MRPPARNVQAPVGLHAHGLGGGPRGHPRHDTSACRLRLLVRLPVDVKEWVAQEALDRGCSMNAVIVDALNAKITSVFGETQNKKHAAAIKAVIDIEQLPKGTAILMPPSHRQRETDLLVRRPADVDYGLLARVSGEDATYAEDDVSAKAMEPLHPSARNRVSPGQHTTPGTHWAVAGRGRRVRRRLAGPLRRYGQGRPHAAAASDQ